MRLPSLAILVGMITWALFSTPARAQDSIETPEHFAGRYFDQMKTGDWDATAHLMHPEALDQLATALRSVAASDPSGELIQNVLGMSTAELDSLGAEGIFARLLGRGKPQMLGMLTQSTIDVIGGTPDPKTGIVYVVYRISTPVLETTISQVAVMPIKRLGQEWRALLTGEIANLASALGARPR